MKLEGAEAARAYGARPKPAQFANRWILSRLAAAIEAARAGIDQYRLDDASSALYRFVWNELCDWYLELSKPLLASSDTACVAETRATLVHVLDSALRALHPMMPFITEEIWQRLPKSEDAPASIMIARYPDAAVEGQAAPEIEQEMTRLQAVVVAARTIRAEHDVHPRLELPLTLRAGDPEVRLALERERAAIAALCNAKVRVEAAGGAEPSAESAVAVAEGVTLIVPLAGLVDVGKERARLDRELKKLEKDLAGVERKLANQDFLARAPAALVEQERTRQRDLTEALERLRAALARLPKSNS
jgi:valyl-tRNA synthetase